MSPHEYREFPRRSSIDADRPEKTPSIVSVEAGLSLVPATGKGVLPRVASPKAVPAETAMETGPLEPWRTLDQLFSPAAVAGSPKLGRALNIAFLSLAGGVGKTTLASALGRLLSGMHRQVVLTDCGVSPSATYHLGEHSHRLGQVQLYYPPAGANALPLSVLRLTLAELGGPESAEILGQVGGDESIVLMDLPCPALVGGIPALAHADHILVPVVPDMQSAASIATLEQIYRISTGDSSLRRLHYVLNRFDCTRPLHHEIRTRLQQMLGERLLSITVREDAAIQDAMAHALNIVDYSPNARVVGDLDALANWISTLSSNEADTGESAAL